MVARASYRRSQARAQQTVDWLGGVSPEYDAKFDFLMHQVPFWGTIANGVDAYRDANYYVNKRVGGWDKVKRTNVLARSFNTGLGSGINFVSKNLIRLYL